MFFKLDGLLHEPKGPLLNATVADIIDYIRPLIMLPNEHLHSCRILAIDCPLDNHLCPDAIYKASVLSTFQDGFYEYYGKTVIELFPVGEFFNIIYDIKGMKKAAIFEISSHSEYVFDWRKPDA